MLLALSVAAASVVSGWVPARWTSNDPKSLDLVADTAVNCLLLEQPLWSPAFTQAASEREIALLGVIHPGADLAAAAKQAASADLEGVVLEGDFQPAAARQLEAALPASAVLIELPPRARLRLDSSALVVGTYQGVWPGVRTEIKAAATGGPWIDTNSGFLRFVRAATDAPVWMSNLPPTGQVIPVERYLQAIADAELVGARWVVALDQDLNRRLLARDPAALRAWQRIGAVLRFFDEHKDWREWKPCGQLAVLQQPDGGALLSGGILDMIATKNTPVRPVPLPKLTPWALQGARMAVNVDPASLNPEQKEALRAFTRGGGTLLNGPPGWKLPAPRQDQITLDQKETQQIDDIWKGINSMIGRENLGARLFNVAGMLSSLDSDPAGRPVLLKLVNYTNYPIESVTVHLAGKFQRARLLAPGAPPRALEPYAIEGGTGFDIPVVRDAAALLVE